MTGTRAGRSCSVRLEPRPRAVDLRVIDQGLQASRRAQGIAYDHRKLAVLVRDEDGALLGGLSALTGWNAMQILELWVDEKARGHGLGSRALAVAEAEAVHRGCHTAWLETMSFDAEAFYRKNGYRRFGALEDSPTGHKHLFLQKKLVG